MPYISISKEVDVDVEIDYDDFDVDDLARVLVTKKNYQAALAKACHSKQTNQREHEDYDKVKALVEAFRLNKPTDTIISDIAYSRYGLVC